MEEDLRGRFDGDPETGPEGPIGIRPPRRAAHGPSERRREVLHGVFEATADGNPGAVAVLAEGGATTYGDLEARANRIARFLRARGVGPAGLVGLLLPRSADAYAALLGILKAGAAYVPLDPECPRDRVAAILEDCRASALVTNEEFADRHGDFGRPVVRLDVDRALIDAGNPERFPVTTGPRDLCWVIYTSGSTGRPKGVMVEHRSACRLVRAEGEIFGVRPGDRVYQGFSLAFDASVEEIWLAFRAGAALDPATLATARAGPDLPAFLERTGVTVLSCIPTLLEMIGGGLPSLRLLILGGEECPAGLVERVARPGLRIVNTYGPTEATVIATFADLEPGKPVTIGRPLAGWSVHVLDESLRPVPRGAAGEICIGGVGVARGYLGLPGMSRERFVPDPFAPEGETAPRLYRTGDRGSFDARGELRFLGRGDDQVKVRGFRVELAEIESALMREKGVRAAACALREDGPGGGSTRRASAPAFANGSLPTWSPTASSRYRTFPGSRAGSSTARPCRFRVPGRPVRPNKAGRRGLSRSRGSPGSGRGSWDSRRSPGKRTSSRTSAAIPCWRPG